MSEGKNIMHRLHRCDNCADNLTFSTSGNKATAYLLDELGSHLRMGRFELYGYDEFGNSLYDMPEGKQPFGFAGYQSDAVAGTWYAQAREYLPQLGRFAGEDKIAGFAVFPQSLNRYGYCWNDHLSLVDLDGEWPQWMRDAGQAAANFWNTHIYGERTVYVMTDTTPMVGHAGMYSTERVSTTAASEVHTGGIIVRTNTVTNGVPSSVGWSLNIPSTASVGATFSDGNVRLNASVDAGQIRAQAYASFGGSDIIAVGGTIGHRIDNHILGSGFHLPLSPVAYARAFLFHEMSEGNVTTYTERGAYVRAGYVYLAVAAAVVAWKALPILLPVIGGLRIPIPTLPTPNPIPVGGVAGLFLLMNEMLSMEGCDN